MHIANAEMYSSHVFLVPGFDKPTEQCHVFYRGDGVTSMVLLYRTFVVTNDVFRYIIRALLRLRLIISLSRIIRSLSFDA
jgi:hypothetical protein